MEVKKYEYNMNVHILEARNLIANSNTAVNPFVRIKVGN